MNRAARTPVKASHPYRRSASSLYLFAACLPLLAAIGCSRGTPGAASDRAAGMQADIEAAAGQVAAREGAAAQGDAPLQPGQQEQGRIVADVGHGQQSYRSLSTQLAQDLDRRIAGQVSANAQASKAIADANARLEAAGVSARMSAEQVESDIASMAGKSLHDAVVEPVEAIDELRAHLNGKAGDGSALELHLSFDQNSLALRDATLAYRPRADSIFNAYEGKNVQVTIERFERNPDGSYALAGTFSAKDVPASPMAKSLPAATLATASGRFDYAALPVKPLPKFGP